MKHLFGFFVAFALALTGVGFTGCSDDKTDEPVPPPVVDPSFEVKLGTVGINDAEITLTTAAVPEYAYIVAEADAQAPSATTIYATGKVESLTDGENKLNINGLEAATQYTVYFAYKVEDQFADVVDLDFTTANYTDRFTMVDRGPDYITIHIEVPADTYYMITLSDWMTAKSMMEQFGTTDFDFIRSGVLYQGPQTITFRHGEPIYPDDPDMEGYNWNIMAGQCFRLILAECDEERFYGDVDFDELGDPIFNWYGFQQTEKVNAGEAIPSQYKVEVEIEKLTTRSVEIYINPDEEIAGYGALFGTKPEIDAYIEEIGLSGLQAMCLGDGSTLAGVEPARYAWDKVLMEGIEYSFVTVGLEEDITRQVMVRTDFTPISATQPAPQVVVTRIDNPEGENSAFQTWFNIKAPNGDADSGVYAFNTAVAWQAVLKEGATYADVLDQNGNDLGSSMAMINSPEGLNIAFDTEESTAFILAVGLCNEEETMGVGVCEATSLADTPDAPVSSSLFEDLLGDWTATTTDTGGKAYTFKVTIANEVEAGPATLPEEVYDLYPTFTHEQVDGFFAEFKEGVTETTEKYKGKNRLVCRGFQVDPYVSYYPERMAYHSPWDLFIHPNYDNSSTKEVFLDYGPKWFLQIAEGDVVTVPTDPIRIPILSNWADAMYLMGYYKVDNYNYETNTPTFPVAVSDDKQTITVNPFVDGEKVFYPSVFYNQNGYMTALFRGASPIVLTKGYDEPAVTANMKARRSYRTDELRTNVKAPTIGKMTRLDGNLRRLTAKRVDMSASLLAGEQLQQAAQAQAAKLARTNR